MPFRDPALAAVPRQERSERTHDLLRGAGDAGGTGDQPTRDRLLDEVVVLNMGVANALAARYQRRGVNGEDLRQVAYVALIKAARRYDHTQGHDFLAYAVPTITGEIKRHFRDQGWAVRPPRRVQELQAAIVAADAELSAGLGRSPRPSEVAAHLGVDLEDVQEALATDGCFTPSSLDRPVGEDGDATLGDFVRSEDDGPGAVEARVVLAPVVRTLGERDRRIVMLRFFHGLTQREIAADIGVTQMQVSRLLTRILGDLRHQLHERDLTSSA